MQKDDDQEGTAKDEDLRSGDEGFEEKEITQFDRALQLEALLLSPDFFPGGLAKVQSDDRSVRNVGEDAKAGLSHQSQQAEICLSKMTTTLDEYQEQSHLLDPYLNDFVGPPMQAFRHCVKSSYQERNESIKCLQASSNLHLLSRLLYHLTKVRGYKTILNFFPHAVGDLLPALVMLETSMDFESSATAWETRYILILWISVVCMIPFDLQSLDNLAADHDRTTVERIQRVGQHMLACSGKERDAASVMLARLFQRKDAAQDPFRAFLLWSAQMSLSSTNSNTFLVTGIMQTLCSAVKAMTPATLDIHLAQIQSHLMFCGENEAQQSNTLVKKYISKLASRLALKMLRPQKQVHLSRIGIFAQAVGEADAKVQDTTEDAMRNDAEIPEQVDEYIGILMNALKDKDTVVRYSAAKGIARICVRLPQQFAHQICSELTSLFSVNITHSKDRGEDLSNVSEHSWQGLCLVFAELARRGLLKQDDVEEVIIWIGKSLTFDIRRGAHSIGSGVRDAACYVVWATARAGDSAALKKHADSLAKKLVCVTLMDRDISIRRAASAAFQECVGRLNVFPFGIDVIGKTDFYAVGARRNAFLHCLPRVAEHAVYRTAIVEHLIDVVICHWDIIQRQLGAKALALVVDFDFEAIAKPVIARLRSKCTRHDVFSLHGGLLSLAEVGRICSSKGGILAQQCQLDALSILSTIPQLGRRVPGMNDVLCASCYLIAGNANEKNISKIKIWEGCVDAALERLDEGCHEAAKEALCTISSLMDLSKKLQSIQTEWSRYSIATRRGYAKVLGAFRFQSVPQCTIEALKLLLSLLEEGSQYRSSNVETRCNACRSIGEIVCGLEKPCEDEQIIHRTWGVLLLGLADYTTDARGDVGSWVRTACMNVMVQLVQAHMRNLDRNYLRLSQDVLDQICAGFAKQIFDRIDSVQMTARKSLSEIVRVMKLSKESLIHLPGEGQLASIFVFYTSARLSESNFLRASAIKLLSIAELRDQVLQGIVGAIGSSRDTVDQELAQALCAYIETHPEEQRIVADVASVAKAHVTSNRIFVPSLQTLNILIERDAIGQTESSANNVLEELKAILKLAILGIDRVKSIARLQAAAQYAVNVLRFDDLRKDALEHLDKFLLHTFPIIRSSAAEMLYVLWQIVAPHNVQGEAMEEQIENILLSTPWSQGDAMDEIQAQQDTLRHLLQDVLL